jgi:hypothetical protein
MPHLKYIGQHPLPHGYKIGYLIISTPPGFNPKAIFHFWCPKFSKKLLVKEKPEFKPALFSTGDLFLESCKQEFELFFY